MNANEIGKKLFQLEAAVNGAIAKLTELSNDAYNWGLRDWQSGDVDRHSVDAVADMLQDAVKSHGVSSLKG